MAQAHILYNEDKTRFALVDPEECEWETEDVPESGVSLLIDDETKEAWVVLTHNYDGPVAGDSVWKLKYITTSTGALEEEDPEDELNELNGADDPEEPEENGNGHG